MSAAPLQVAVTDGVACVRVAGPANVTLGLDFKAVVANACEQGGRVLQLLHLGDGPNPFDDQLTAAERTDADKRKLAKASLEAHRLLMEVNPDNVPKFRDVTKFLAEEVEGGA